MIQYFTIKNFLTEEETNTILKFSIENLQLKPGRVRDYQIDETARKSSVSFVNYDTIFPFLKNKLKNRICEIIKLKGYEINFQEPFQFTEYKIGEHYVWHTDASNEGENANRYCSIVIQLNNEYTGGELEMQLSNSEEIIKFEKGNGNLFVFLSNIKHRVTKVESGVRYSLVSWFSLKPINDYKKTII